MTPIDLSAPMRQSSKGILIIFAYRLFSFVKKTFLLFVASIFTLLKKETFLTVKPVYLILGIALILGAFLTVAILRYLNFIFYVKQDEFHLKTGILNKETIILPKSKIQNIYIEESFLHRLIDVVALKIESAGDKSSEIEINALDKKTAILLKEKLFDFKETTESQSEIKEPQLFFKVSVKKLILEGLTQNHFKSLAIIFGFFVGLYYENQQLVEEYGLEDKLAEWLNVSDALIENVILFNSVLLVIGLLISMIVSVIKMIVGNFDLKVLEHRHTFEISKGLIQTMSLSLSPERIQNIVIKTNRIKQHLGLHTLTVKQAMVNEKQSTNFSIVGLDRMSLEHLTTSLAKDYRALDSIDRNYSEPYYKRILFLKFGLIAVVVNGFMIGLLHWYTILFFLFSLFVVWFCVTKSYQKNYFYFDDSYLTKGSGLIETNTNIMALHKLQSVHVVQNIFHKKRGLATLKLTTASQKLTIPYIKKSNAVDIADFLLYKLESQNKDWM